VEDLQYDAGLRFEWDLFEGFERRNNVNRLNRVGRRGG